MKLKKSKLSIVAFMAIMGVSTSSYGANFTVSTSDDDGTGAIANTLSWAILQANQAAGLDTITLGTDVNITGVMKTLIDSDITIQSDGISRTISGDDKYRPLFIKSGQVIIKDMTISHGKAKGGDNMDGGAGAGLGGGVFVYDGNVTIDNVTFDSDNATGGSTNVKISSSYGDGGAGMYGDSNYVGGAGLFASSSSYDGAYGGSGNYGGSAGSQGEPIGGAGGFAGGGGPGYSYSATAIGGAGGFGAGGGFAYSYENTATGGAGGFGAGGGFAYSYENTATGGAGGFGAGGGGAGTEDGTAIAGIGGYGGADATGYYGGAGAGFGGALFAMAGTTTLNNVTFLNNSVTAGVGNAPGSDGMAKAADVFICTDTIHPTAALCSAKVNFCGTTNSTEIIGTTGSVCPTDPTPIDPTPTDTAKYDVSIDGVVSSVTAEDIPGAKASIDINGNHIIIATYNTYTAVVTTTPTGETTAVITNADGTVISTQVYPIGVSISIIVLNGQLVVRVNIQTNNFVIN